MLKEKARDVDIPETTIAQNMTLLPRKNIMNSIFLKKTFPNSISYFNSFNVSMS